jgi:SAM-dependent methyltransferase
MEENNYRNETNIWLKSLNLKGGVIDIGGGKRTAKERMGSCEGEYNILDRKHYRDLQFNPDIEHDINYPLDTDKQYDYAFLLFTFEFLWNPVQAFQNISKLVKKNGKFYFNAPYKMPTESYVEEDYYRITRTGIDKLLKETGFKLENIKRHSGEFDFYLVTAQKI